LKSSYIMSLPGLPASATDAAAGGEDQQVEAPPKEDCGVKGQEYLNDYVDSSASECLNEDDEHPYKHAMTSEGGFLQSDCDEQLILSLSFNQVR